MENKINITEKLPEYVPSLGRLLNFSTNAVNRYCQGRLSEHDLTLPQWVILSVLWRKDGLPINDLAQYAGTNPPAASRIIDRMVLNGTVRRRNDRTDGRSVRVYLTKAGKSLDGLTDFYKEVNDMLLQGFSDKESKQLFEFMERVLENATTSIHSQSSSDRVNSD